jgi:hypothetical protein
MIYHMTNKGIILRYSSSMFIGANNQNIMHVQSVETIEAIALKHGLN